MDQGFVSLSQVAFAAWTGEWLIGLLLPGCGFTGHLLQKSHGEQENRNTDEDS